MTDFHTRRAKAYAADRQRRNARRSASQRRSNDALTVALLSVVFLVCGLALVYCGCAIVPAECPDPQTARVVADLIILCGGASVGLGALMCLVSSLEA